MTKKQIEAMMAKQKEASKSTPFLNTEMGQYAYQLGFEDGVDHALSHQWVSVEDELPPALSKCDPISDRVLVHTSSDCVFVDHYDNYYDEWLTAKMDNNEVTHWMPIPPLAEEGGEKK